MVCLIKKLKKIYNYIGYKYKFILYNQNFIYKLQVYIFNKYNDKHFLIF